MPRRATLEREDRPVSPGPVVCELTLQSIDRRSLAFHFLHAGHRVTHAHYLGAEEQEKVAGNVAAGFLRLLRGAEFGDRRVTGRALRIRPLLGIFDEHDDYLPPFWRLIDRAVR